MGRRGLSHTLGSASATRKRASLLPTTPAAAVRFHLVLDTVKSDPASVNRRRPCPISVLLSHHRCPVTSSCVVVDPSSCCVTPMTTNNQSVVVGRLVATSLWATWHLGCVCDYGSGREGMVPWPRRRVVVVLWCHPGSQPGGLIGRWDGVLTVS